MTIRALFLGFSTLLLACSDPAAQRTAPVDDPPVDVPTPRVMLQFEGDGAGVVDVIAELEGEVTLLGSCTSACVLPAKEGQRVTLTAASPSVFGGFSGACTSSEPACELTVGADVSSVDVRFSRAPGEAWTVFASDGTYVAAAFDAAGALVVASATVLRKYDASGAQVWEAPLAGTCALATGPFQTIYAQTGNDLHELTDAGAVIWTRPLPDVATGCGETEASGEGFGRSLAVGFDGTSAVGGLGGLASWDIDGNVRFSARFPNALMSTGIDDSGHVSALVDRVLRNFDADGTPRADSFTVARFGHARMAIGPRNLLLVASSSTDTASNDLFRARAEIHDPFEILPSVLVAAGEDVAWFYERDDASSNARPFTLQRFAADGSVVATYVADTFEGTDATVGLLPRDAAGAADGRVAVVGAINNERTFRQWITVFQR